MIYRPVYSALLLPFYSLYHDYTEAMPDINTLTSTPTTTRTLPTLPTEIIYNILSYHIEQSYIDCLAPLPSTYHSTTSVPTCFPSKRIQATGNVDIYDRKKIHTNISFFAYNTLRLARTSTLFLFELSGLLDPISAHVHERWIEATKALQRVRAMWYMRVWYGSDAHDDNTSEESDESNDDDSAGSDMGEKRRLSLKEKERLWEAEVEGCWRDVCVIASLGAKMRALRVCVAGRWEREDRLRAAEQISIETKKGR